MTAGALVRHRACIAVGVLLLVLSNCNSSDLGQLKVRCWRCQVSGARCQVSGVRCSVSGVRCEVSGARCQVSGVRCQVCGRRCKVSGVRCQVWSACPWSRLSRHEMGVVVHRATRVRRRECPTTNASNDPIPNDQRFQRSTINVADDGLINGAHFLPSGSSSRTGLFAFWAPLRRRLGGCRERLEGTWVLLEGPWTALGKLPGGSWQALGGFQEVSWTKDCDS